MTMSETMTFTGELKILRCWCGITHAVPESLRTHQLRQKEDGQSVMGIFCPLGHSHVPGGLTKVQREAKREKEWREASEARASALDDQLQAERRQHAATKGKLTKMRKRIAAGVCPCCNRTFKQVRRHMETQHPEEAAMVFAGDST